MTQRLTPERLAYIRDDVNVTYEGDHTYFARELLAELDALRAELVGAEERGRQKERSRCEDIAAREAGFADDDSPEQDALFRIVACIHSEKTDEIMRKRFDHVRAGTTPPDAGESGP